MNKIEIEIPDGKRAEWVNGVLTLVDDAPKFKNGDVVVFGLSSNSVKIDSICIVKRHNIDNSYDFHVYCAFNRNHISYDDSYNLWIGKLATEEEKQQLFDALAKVGKQWNAEKLCIEDIEDKLPKTWEESFKVGDLFCCLDISSSVFSDVFGKGDSKPEYKNSLHTKEQAEAMLAFIQLIWLRDIYRQGWLPNWDNANDKYNIRLCNNFIEPHTTIISHHVLSFQSKEIRDKFLENFKDLIEKAKMFI